MSANSDSTNSGIPVTFSFSQQAASCLGPQLVEVLTNMDARIDLPAASTGDDVSVRISTLDDNGSRLDAEGALYTPAVQVVELTSQTVTIGDSTGPNIQTSMVFSAPSVNDLQTALPSIFFEYTPVTANIRQVGPRLSNGNILYDFFRVDDDSDPPYPVVTIRGYGRIFVFPAPSSSV